MNDPAETSEFLAFTKAADAKSLSRAAAELGIPRATLGRRLARFEERLGARLLRRTTRSLSLTEAGEAFYRHARIVLDAVSAAEQSVRRTDETLRGTAVLPLIITFVVSFLTAAVLAGSAALAQHFYDGSFFLNAVLTSVILWIGFTAARMITHDLFERRNSSLTVLNLAHELVTVVVMGLVIGAFGFPG